MSDDAARRLADVTARLARVTAERDKAEAEARDWRERYFEHMRDEHPEVYRRRVGRRTAA
jgi:hypothetical protein